jgi:protein SCO1/2
MSTKKRSNDKFFAGIAVALLVPLFCYFVVSHLSKGVVKMPGYYGIEKIDTVNAPGKRTRDTLYHHVADIELTNQLGKKISMNKDLAGKMVVIDFIFTRCPAICPRISKSMELLQTSFRKDPKKEAQLDTIVQFVSITVDPGYDSFQVLRAYADRFNANHDKWWFLTGDKHAIYNYARHELGVETGPGDGSAEDFIHTQQFILLDKERMVRGYYDGLNDTDVRKCADDIVLLTLEKKHRK